MALWGGRFSQGADSRFKQFNDSLRFDYRLAEQAQEQTVDGQCQYWLHSGTYPFRLG